MDNQFEYDEEEELRRERWKKKIAEMKRQKEKRERLRRRLKYVLLCGGGVLCTAIFIGAGIHFLHRNVDAKGAEKKEEISGEEGLPEDIATQNTVEESIAEETTVEEINADIVPADVPEVLDGKVDAGGVELWSGYQAETTPATIYVLDEEIQSKHAILIDASSGTIVAKKDADSIICPASMTKILTVLVAAEHVTDLDDEFTITLEMTDYAYVNDCSSVGFLDGETVTVRDLFYGTVLPSGGDAAVALAIYVAGSQEAFVDMMNEKLEELGLSDTAHFTNCVGVYDKDHYCTTYDMAIILKAALENDWCREVLSAHTYTTSATEEHPEGITISNWFLRRIEDKDCGGEVLCAKTGFVNQSGSCAASYELAADGTPYICVTADTYSSWRCIYDHVAMYSLYARDSQE